MANYGGGGNCTRVLDYASHAPASTCENCPLVLSELCRDDATLHELVTSWHRLTSGVREKIVEIARGATRDFGLNIGRSSVPGLFSSAGECEPIFCMAPQKLKAVRNEPPNGCH